MGKGNGAVAMSEDSKRSEDDIYECLVRLNITQLRRLSKAEQWNAVENQCNQVYNHLLDVLGLGQDPPKEEKSVVKLN